MPKTADRVVAAGGNVHSANEQLIQADDLTRQAGAYAPARRAIPHSIQPAQRGILG